MFTVDQTLSGRAASNSRIPAALIPTAARIPVGRAQITAPILAEASCKISASPNTVQLGARCAWNTGPRWTGRLRPRLVPVPLHVPLDVLALDDSRVAAMATGRIEPPRKQRDGVSPAVVSVLRGKNRAPLRSSGERCGVRRRS